MQNKGEGNEIIVQRIRKTLNRWQISDMLGCGFGPIFFFKVQLVSLVSGPGRMRADILSGPLGVGGGKVIGGGGRK